MNIGSNNTLSSIFLELNNLKSREVILKVKNMEMFKPLFAKYSNYSYFLDFTGNSVFISKKPTRDLARPEVSDPR